MLSWLNCSFSDTISWYICGGRGEVELEVSDYQMEILIGTILKNVPNI
jgi:hypothetical protein